MNLRTRGFTEIIQRTLAPCTSVRDNMVYGRAPQDERTPRPAIEERLGRHSDTEGDDSGRPSRAQQQQADLDATLVRGGGIAAAAGVDSPSPSELVSRRHVLEVMCHTISTVYSLSPHVSPSFHHVCYLLGYGLYGFSRCPEICKILTD